MLGPMRTLFRGPERRRVRPPAPEQPQLIRLTQKQVASKQEAFARRRTFGVDDYTALLEPYREHESLTLDEYVRQEELGDRRVLVIRHDVDHDHITAVRIAEWEAARGLRATYCLLHTAWYYGELVEGRYVHTEDVLDCARRLIALGHEVNLHNNLVTLALQTPGLDPEQVLVDELAFFRDAGVPITGTAGHGDRLCRELGYRNWELFAECADDRFGGPRTLLHAQEGRSRTTVELGRVRMADHGLAYEAYDVARDVYHTESGGRMRTRHRAPGRRAYGRTDPVRGEVVGVLTHPLWWDFPAP